MKRAILVLLVTFLMAIPACITGGIPINADNFEDGFVAADRGDYKTAYKLWLPHAEQGDDEAQFNLGLISHQGLGVQQDFKDAIKWYRLSAEQGNSSAQNNLGEMYNRGQGVPQDYIEC